MTIKNDIHAIDLTIKRHQVVLDGKFGRFEIAKDEMALTGWLMSCPLCEYYDYCDDCICVENTGFKCNSDNQRYDYNNDPQSIKRLNKWKKRIKSKK